MFIKYLSINPVIHAHITRSLYFAVVYMNQGLAVNATTLSHASSLLFIFSVFASDRCGYTLRLGVSELAQLDGRSPVSGSSFGALSCLGPDLLA